MYKIIKKREAYFLDLPFGIRVKLAPFSTSLVQQVVSKASRELVGIIKEQMLVRENSGAFLDAEDNLSDEEVRKDKLDMLMLKHYAMVAIQSWEGVEDKDVQGKEAACTKENICILLEEPAIGRALWQHFDQDLGRIYNEGKSSCPVANGTSDSGQDTVKDVSPSTNAKVET